MLARGYGMAMILLAVEDAGRDAAVRDLLTAEGWWVTTVGSQDEALRAAADHAPQLLIVDPRLAHADALVRAFARRDGGPGVLLLVDQADEVQDLGVDGEDGVLVRSQAPRDVLARVRHSLETLRGGDAATRVHTATDTARQLTATDLFGDILEQMGEAGTPAPRGHAALVDAVVDETPPKVAAEPPPKPEGAMSPPPASRPAPSSLLEDVTPAEPGAPTEPELAVPASEPEAPVPTAASQSVFEPEPVEPEPTVEAEPTVETEAAAAVGATVEPTVEPEAPAESPVESQVPVEPEPAATVAFEVSELPDDRTEVEPPVVAAQTTPDTVSPDGTEDGDGDAIEGLAGEVAELLEAAEAGIDDDVAAAVGSLSIHEVLPGGEEDAPDDDDLWLEEVEGALAAASQEVAPDDAAAPAAAAVVEPGEPAGEPVSHDIVGSYRLLELLEFGDLTERWLAVRKGDEERVVVERIRHELRDRPDVRQAFVDGHSEAAGWEHDSILRVLDLGRDGDIDYVVTEYCPGHSLREVLERVRRMDARMPLGVCLLVVERLASALQAIGDGPAGSRHGWVVPGSVWLGDDGRVLLREFGCGRLGPVDEAPVRDWRDYRFLAPELWTGKPDIRSDLYALGALLYEMVSIHPVHTGEDLESLKLVVTTEDVTPVQRVDPTIPSEVDAWIMRLLRRSVEDRPPAVMEIQSKVDLALQALPARPGDAEMAAYLRQLFTARMPEIPEDLAPSTSAIEAAVEEEAGDESPAVGGSRRWWWILAAALLALVVAGYFLWRAKTDDAAARPETTPSAAPAPVDPAAGEAATEDAVDPPPGAATQVPAAASTAAAPPEDDLDVAGLVAEEFARRQRDLEQRLREQEAAAAAAAPSEPPADGEQDEGPGAATGDDGGRPPPLH
jgi:serine/threonine protein kinase